MTVSSSRLRQFSVLFLTCSVLIVLLSLYFFMWIPGQEAELNELSFRTLIRTEENVIKKSNDLKKYALTVAKDYVTNQYWYYENNKTSSKLMDPVRRAAAINDFYDLTAIEFIYHHFTEKDKWLDSALRKSVPVMEENVFLENTWEQNGGTWKQTTRKYKYGYKFAAEKLVGPFIRKDIFDDFAVIKDKEVLYSSLHGLKISKPELLLKDTSGIQSSTIHDIVVSGISYKAFFHPITVGKESWIMAGLIKSDNYSKRKMAISGNVVMIVLLFSFLLVLTMPFIKLMMMSLDEKLSRNDVLLTAVSMILGTAVLFLLLFDGYEYLGPYKRMRDHQLTGLAESIEKSFVNELDSALTQLHHFDKLIDSLDADIISLADSPLVQKKNSKWKMDSLAKPVSVRYYPLFNNVSWIDEYGMQVLKWTTTTNTTRINVKERQYFKNITEHKSWRLPKKDTISFTLESAYSWTQGQSVAVLSIPSVHQNISGSTGVNNKTAVASISSRLYSVIDPLIPPGFGFRIIDEKGDVWFHSDSKMNLKENIFEECSHPVLTAAHYSRSNASFKGRYQGDYHRFYYTPIDGLPLSLITYHENEYSRSDNMQIISFTMLLIISFFLFICMQVLVQHLLHVKPSRLSYRNFTFGWMWPVAEKKQTYFESFLIQLILIILLCVFIQISRPLESILLIFTASVYKFLVTYLKLNNVTVFSSFGKKYAAFTILSIFLILGLNILSWKLIGEFAALTGFQLLFIFCVYLLNFIPEKINILSYKTSYILLMVSWLSLTSIIPAVLFFRISYNRQMEHSVRHAQAEMAVALNNGIGDKDKPYRIKQSGDTLQNDDIHYGAFFKTRIDTVANFHTIDSSTSKEDYYFNKIEARVRPPFDPISITNNHLLLSDQSDHTYIWKKNGDSLTLNYRSPLSSKKQLQVSSLFPSHQVPVPKDIEGILFWLSLTAAAVSIFFFIRFIMRKIFLVDLLDDSDLPGSDLSLMEVHKEDTRYLFLIGLPFSGKSGYVDTLYPPGDDRLAIDLVNTMNKDRMDEALFKASHEFIHTIVIDHFEYGCFDPAVNLMKLEFLEKLIQLKDKKIILISAIHPLAFISRYKQRYEGATGADKEKIVIETERWTRLMSCFYKLYYPLQGLIQPVRDTKAPAHIQRIEEECRHGQYLSGLKDTVTEFFSRKKLIPADEEIILNIQSLAHIYYTSFWESFTAEEKHLILDLADDGLVNSENFETIAMLIKKGVFIYDGQLKIMNESFRNFVLSNAKSNQASFVPETLPRTGAWARFKGPVLIVLLVVALFVAITQKQAFAGVIAFITAFMGSFDKLPQFINMISSLGGKK